MPLNFTFTYIEEQYQAILNQGYSIITCEEYYKIKNQLPPKILVNRVDIDISVIKAERLIDIFDKLGIKATFFVRLHAKEYNPFSFENYRIIKKLIQNGHELGYHSETIDQAAIWGEDPVECFLRDLRVIENAFGIKMNGVASHGGMTGLNNLDFWKDRKASDFGLLYEAYDREPTFNLFHKAFYVSDSEWIRWKCYDKGKLLTGDHRSPSEHVVDQHDLIHLLIHPETYYNKHFYE